MAKKKKSIDERPLVLNPAWVISYAYTHGKEELVPGDIIKFKGERGTFKFLRHVHHMEKNVDWIDCIGDSGYRSFYVQDLKGKLKPKKPRKKKFYV